MNKRFSIFFAILLLFAILGGSVSFGQASVDHRSLTTWEQHDFGNAGVQNYVYSSGRSWNFTAENDMTVQNIEISSVLASYGGTFNIQVRVNGDVEASWSQFVNNPTFQAYPHSAVVDFDLNVGDTITYYIYGGTASSAAGAITGPNYVQLSDSEGGEQSAFQVSAVYPTANAVSISADSVISTTFNLPVDFSTISSQTFTVRGDQTGIYTGSYTQGSVNFQASQNFKPGERVMVTLSDGIKTITETALLPYSWLFDVAVDGGAGQFMNSGQSLGSSETMSAAAGDLDGDGDVDVFTASGSGQPNLVWINDGTATFTSNGQSLGSGNGMDVALGDLDRDGDLDAFIANGGANKVWMNDGNAQFSDSGQNLGSIASNSVDLGDLDGDGDLDAFLGNENTIEIWLNDGSGNFTGNGQDDLETGYTSSGVALGDLDGDGDLDVFTCNNIANEVWFNDGAGQFSDTDQELGSYNCYEVAIGDLDGDHDLDAFTANFDWPEGQPDKVWINDGTGVFADSGQSLDDESSLGVDLGDLDADGDLDAFIAGNSSEGNLVWINDGSANFTINGQNIDNFHSESIALADYDLDGDLDAYITNLACGGRPDTVWLNTHQYNQYLPIIFKAEQTVIMQPSAPVLNDIENSDGDGNFTVSWSGVDYAISYNLEEDDNADFTSPETAYAGADTSVSISGKDDGTYYYRVLAETADGDSYWSETKSVVVTGEPTAVPAPLLYSIYNPDNISNYMIYWTDVEGSLIFTLEEDDTTAFSTPTVVYSGTGTLVSITGQPVGTHYYRVKVTTGAGTSDWSNTQSTVVSVSPPSELQIGSWTGTTDQSKDITFDVSSEAHSITGYQVSNLSISYTATCERGEYPWSTTISSAQSVTDSHFDVSNIWVRVIGDFITDTTAQGMWISSEFYHSELGLCSGNGTWTASITP